MYTMYGVEWVEVAAHMARDLERRQIEAVHTRFMYMCKASWRSIPRRLSVSNAIETGRATGERRREMTTKEGHAETLHRMLVRVDLRKLHVE